MVSGKMYLFSIYMVKLTCVPQKMAHLRGIALKMNSRWKEISNYSTRNSVLS